MKCQRYLQRVRKCDHASTFIDVGQSAPHGAKIVGHMCRVAGAGNDRGHTRISKKEFKEELRPAAGKASCPIWYQLAEHRLEQAAATKWQSGE